MASDKEIALYYPYIEITDASLIKTAALYWDEIQTIVPSGLDEFYITPLTKEAKEAGFLKPRIVDSWQDSVIKAGTEFVQDLTADVKVKQTILNLIASNKLQELDYPDYIPFDMGKIDTTSLWHICQELSEVKISLKFHDGENLAFPKPLFYPYMSRLASVLATETNAVPLTNETQYHNIMLDRYADYTEERRQNQAQLANLSLQTLSIRPEVSLVDIRRFRDIHHAELIKYRSEIRKLTRGLHNLDTTEKQSELEAIVRDDIIPAKTEIETKLRSEEDFFMVGNTVIAVSVAGTVFLSGGQAWLAAVLHGVASLGLNLYGNIRAERHITDHPFGLLYKAHKQFGSNQ